MTNAPAYFGSQLVITVKRFNSACPNSQCYKTFFSVTDGETIKQKRLFARDKTSSSLGTSLMTQKKFCYLDTSLGINTNFNNHSKGSLILKWIISF